MLETVTIAPCPYLSPSAWRDPARLLVASWTRLERSGWRAFLRCSGAKGSRMLAEELGGVLRMCPGVWYRLAGLAMVVNAEAREAARVMVGRELGR